MDTLTITEDVREVSTESADVQRFRCELCRHFQKDEYTGYCRTHHAYVLKTFRCAQFESASALNGGLK